MYDLLQVQTASSAASRNAGNPATEEWLVGRGWANGNMNGIVTQANMPLTATYDHDPSNKGGPFLGEQRGGARS